MAMAGERYAQPGFQTGSIVRVKLHNFMSYSDTEFFAGPRLNMVIGPNGSGKSTIVCALALGLGGTPKLLSRSSTVSGFIKTGCDKCRIEIELYDKFNGNAIVVREIFGATPGSKKNSKGTSSYTWRGKPVSENNLKMELKRNYSIQVDNPTQFLPQDKVSAFSKMDGQELLTETIRAGLGSDFLVRQTQLIQRESELKDASVTMERQKQDLELKRKQFDKMSKTVEVLKERQKKEEELIFYEAKIRYQEYEMATNEYKYMKEETKAKKAVAREALTAFTAAEDELRKKKKEASQGEDEGTARDKKFVHNLPKKLKNFGAETTAQVTEVEKGAEAIKTIAEDRVKRLKDMREVQAQLESHEQTMKNWKKKNDEKALLKKKSALTAERRDIDKEVSANTQQKRAIVDEMDKLETKKNRLSKKLHGLLAEETSKEAPLQRLPGYLKSTVMGAWNKVKDMMERKVLHKEVFLILLEVKCGTEALAWYLEKAVNVKNLCTFVTQNEHDRELVMGIRGINVMNISKVGQGRHATSKDTQTTLGLQGYLDELIQGPSPVIQALRNISNIDSVLIGLPTCDKKITNFDETELGRMLNNQIVFSPTTKRVFKTSKYSKNISIVNDSWRLGKPRAIDVDVSEDLKHEIESLKESIKSTQTKLDNNDKDLKNTVDCASKLFEKKETASNELHAVQEILQARNTIENAIKRAKVSMDKLKKKNSKTLAQEIKTNLVSSLTDLKELVDCTSKCNKVIDEFDKVQDRRVSQMLRKTKLKTKMRQATLKLDKLKKRKETTEYEYSSFLAKRDKLKQNASLMANDFKDFSAKHGMDSEENKEKLTSMSDDLTDLESERDLLKQSLAQTMSDPGLLQRYNELKTEIELLEPKVDDFESSHETLRIEFEEERNIWIEKVEDLVDKVNIQFRQGFEAVEKKGYECAGTVALEKPDNAIDQYRVAIKVRFRKGVPLQPLQVETQSGGERSLVTFLYLLALNKISQVPFRVVDEINQGMDATKERLSFDQLVASCCGEEAAKSQYFLITPKLLTGLKYHKDITFHVIFNGPGALPQKDFSWQHFVKRKLGEPEAVSSSRKRIRA
uniref:Structural maintenance of chromosomes protein 5 n=1 Tax=Mucochytrium quahogii TaxID=96639 RepID=A0A7S2RPJ8_9STRA|mmetsp:Transcript_36906/g.59990  ORF Transcript_36906/g.59990 Transcript_36906/m.59990 type:complete len:1084 (-) Transcript_36906:628-3879(-)